MAQTTVLWFWNLSDLVVINCFNVEVIKWIFAFQLVTSPLYALCVSATKANLRVSPSPKAKISWVVGKYTPLLRVGRQGSWYKVQDQDGQTHWVYNKSVNRKWQCVSVKVPSANLRQGPGSQHPLGDIWQADRYTGFKRLDIADNGWYQVEAPWGGTYWMSNGLVWRPVRVRGINY